jgi:hypothetical protein
LVIKEMGTNPGSPDTVVKGNWQLLNAFITEVNFGNHSYDSEDMIDIQMTLRYDWAEYQQGDVVARGT